MAPRARHVEEEAGEGYFASVSDLMVGILFIFLLMLTVFALNFHDAADEQVVARKELDAALQRANAAEQAAERAKADAEAARREAEAAKARADAQMRENGQLRGLLEQAVSQLQRDLEERQNARSKLLATVGQALRERKIPVTVNDESGILRLSGDLLFDTGQSDLKPAARVTVRTIAEILNRTLGCYADGGRVDGCDGGPKPILESVLVEGHTDRQPYNRLTVDQSLDANDRLSTDRALTVFKELRQSQPTLDALRNTSEQPLMAFSGYGQRRPLPDAQGATEADYQRNRRIDLRFVLSARTSEEFNRLREQIMAVLGHR